MAFFFVKQQSLMLSDLFKIQDNLIALLSTSLQADCIRKNGTY